MTSDTPTGNNGMKPWLRLLLILSLALNLLVVGAVVGAMITWSNWRPHHGPRLESGGGPLTRALSHEDRRAIGKEMRKAWRDSKQDGHDHHAELAGLVADLKVTPFDPAPVAARLRRHRQSFDERLDLGLTLLLERLTRMTPEERASYADRLQEVLDKRHGGRKGGKDGKSGGE
ncbi:periplasmic heavy metal sensor [Roseovarius sp. CAU 1744]|uniref:periplasmic heavy metal sensor n=1 Tax=Roseovarius sp. CAU 1744 TaxID=3140368 RepID=UPI00325B835D